MLFLILSLSFFLVTIAGHIFLHRFLVRQGIKSYRSIYIFGFGLVWTFFILLYVSANMTSSFWWNVKAPIASSLIYALLSFIYYIYFGNAYLGEDSPSSRIFYHLEKGPKTYEQILSYFSDESLILKRLRNLVDAKLIEHKDGMYVVTQRGKLMMFIFERYRHVLSWNKGG